MNTKSKECWIERCGDEQSWITWLIKRDVYSGFYGELSWHPLSGRSPVAVQIQTHDINTLPYQWTNCFENYIFRKNQKKAIFMQYSVHLDAEIVSDRSMNKWT